MTSQELRFKRVVVSLRGEAPSDLVRFAADLARLLRIELFGLFVEDPRLLGLAGLPFVREFRPLAGGWHPIDTVRLGDDLAMVRRLAERAFTEAAGDLGAPSRFEVVSGATADMLRALAPSGDLLVIGAPAAAEVARDGAGLIEQAIASADAVMLLPPRRVRSTGPVAVVAEAPNDPIIGFASRIAQALGETVAILRMPSPAPGAMPAVGPTGLAQALDGLRERMIVLRQGAAATTLFQYLSSVRQVPVLILDHDGEAGSGGA